MVEQLAHQSLRDHGKSHGVYLIGWTSEWKSPEGTGREYNDLVRHLDEQVRGLHGNPGHPVVAIKPIVLDLRWRVSPAEKSLIDD